jgi:hypothetical protein
MGRMDAIALLLTLIWGFFILFWDTSLELEGKFLAPLHRVLEKWVRNLGLDHHWKLYTEGHWDQIAQIEFRIYFPNGQLLVLPVDDPHLVVWLRNVRGELYNSTAVAYLNHEPQASAVELVMSVRRRPEDPKGWREKFRTPSNFVERTVILAKAQR